jgi:Sec-independent protein translocase protein TatA
MFGIGWVEIAIVALVVFLFMKPEDVPKVMRKFGNLVRQIRKFSRAVNSDLQSIARDIERMDNDSGPSQSRAQKSEPEKKPESEDKHTEET